MVFGCRWGISNGHAVIKIGEVSKNVTSPAGRLVNRFQSQGAQGTHERICNKRTSRIEDRRSPSSILYLQSSTIILAMAFFNGL
jgi:hypothetical protein